MSNLANIYWSQGRYEQAETLQVQALDGYKRVFGLGHPTTLIIVRNPAETYRNRIPQRQPEYETLCS
jgi:hypothetical protein